MPFQGFYSGQQTPQQLNTSTPQRPEGVSSTEAHGTNAEGVRGEIPYFVRNDKGGGALPRMVCVSLLAWYVRASS
ncbi:hypothetical protein [Tannerella forsythia]|uniref:hypothetical protein n=1 Tax=Tannerella forsythia TaxID=28112 RepID=UPI00117E3A7E|nr:hypothetical protein [Tannerella forsythia]